MTSWRMLNLEVYKDYLSACAALDKKGALPKGPLKIHGRHGAYAVNDALRSYPFARFFRVYGNFSMYDHLFGSKPVNTFNYELYLGRGAPRTYPALGVALATGRYLEKSGWKGKYPTMSMIRSWIDVNAIAHGNYFWTDQMRQAKGFPDGLHLPDLKKFSEVVFEEFGDDPLRTAKDYVVSAEDIEKYLSENDWYPRELFKNVVAFGGFHMFYPGLKSYLIEEDIVPRVPISVLPDDNELATGLYGLLEFLDEVWENPDILDEVVKYTPVAIYTRRPYRDIGQVFRILLPYFVVPWGYLFFFMNWYTLTAVGFEGTPYVKIESFAKKIHPSVVSITVQPAIPAAFFPAHVYWDTDVARAIQAQRDAFSYLPPALWDQLYALYLHTNGNYYFSPYLWASWRYRTYAWEDIAAGVANVWKPYKYSQRLLPFVIGSLFWSPLGFGYISRGDSGKYTWSWGDAFSSYIPWRMVTNAFTMGYEDGAGGVFFSYSSLPFLEYLRKFVFLVFEMLRRYGWKYFPEFGFEEGKLSFDWWIDTHNGPFASFKEYEMRTFSREYSDPSQFKYFPFEFIFNMGVSIAQSVMYADVPAFRNLHERFMYQLARVAATVLGPDAISKVPASVIERHAFIYHPTYSSTVVYVEQKGSAKRGYGGAPDVVDFSVGTSAFYSPFTPGVFFLRFPWYDRVSYQFLLSFWIARQLPTIGFYDLSMHKIFGFFDDSTTEWIPAAIRWDDLYKQYGSSVSPMYVASYPEGVKMVHRFVERVLRMNYDKEGYVNFLLSAYAAHVSHLKDPKLVAARIVQYFQEDGMAGFASKFSELVAPLLKRTSSEKEEGGSEDEQSSL